MNIPTKLQIFDILGWTLIVIAVVTILFTAFKSSRTHYRYDVREENELLYWSTKYQLVNVVDSVIKAYSPNSVLSALILVNECDRYGIDIRLPLAQGLIESCYGTKGLARHTNSVWNFGAFDGVPYDKILNIYKYPHPNKSIEPYLKLLSSNYLGNSKTEYDLLDNFVNFRGERYASNPNYENELKIVLNNFNDRTTLNSKIEIYTRLKLITGR